MTLLYKHVLGRVPDQDGYNFWLNDLEKHGETRAEMLARFSVSEENKAALAGIIFNGILYQKYIG